MKVMMFETKCLAPDFPMPLNLGTPVNDSESLQLRNITRRSQSHSLLVSSLVVVDPGALALRAL